MKIQDQAGNILTRSNLPQRIVSLVPSQTELLYHLGLNEQVVGITKFCIHPDEWFRSKTRVGGTKQVAVEKVLALQPDLVIANKEENVKEQVEAIAATVPVWVTDVNTLPEALQMIRQLGALTGTAGKADAIAAEVDSAFSQLTKTLPPTRPGACYLIWQDPLMTTGQDTFINAMLEAAGFTNCFAAKNRYPELTEADIRNAAPDVLLLSSEPFPFGEKHRQYWQEQLPATQVVLADGEFFSWYGSRLLQAPAYFQSLRAVINLPFA